MLYFSLTSETGVTFDMNIKSSYDTTGFTYVMIITNPTTLYTRTFLIHDISPFVDEYSGNTNTISNKVFDYNVFDIELFEGECETDFDPLIPKVNFRKFEGHSNYTIYYKGINDGSLTYDTDDKVDEGFIYINYPVTSGDQYYSYSKTYTTY